MANKKIPLRTCVGCRKQFVKRELVRISQGPEGAAEVDLSGSTAGRGVYLCRRPQCWTQGLKRDRIGIALRTSITQQTKSNLLEALQTQLYSREIQED